MKLLVKILSPALLFPLFIVPSCLKPDGDTRIPGCVKKQISEIEENPVQNPPAQVWEWKADNNVYYYFTSPCCDQMNILYDIHCNMVCAPDGGISGNGDGNCPQFKGAVLKEMIWEDPRSAN